MKSLLLALLFAASGAHAQLAFKGFAVGGDRDALLSKFASLKCSAPPPQLMRIGDAVCRERPCSGAQCEASTAALATYGGVPAWDAQFMLVAGRAEAFSLNFASTSYEAVRDALREAHGAGVETTDVRQLLSGARVATRIWEAGVGDGKITAVERSTELKTGSVFAQSQAFTQWQHSQPAVRKRAGDL